VTRKVPRERSDTCALDKFTWRALDSPPQNTNFLEARNLRLWYMPRDYYHVPQEITPRLSYFFISLLLVIQTFRVGY